MPQKVQGSKELLGVEMSAVQHEVDGRARILTAARSLFSSKGFHQTSMAQLASAAQVSVGQIYRLFHSSLPPRCEGVVSRAGL
jgi:AcrR family transcriptional regulator